ncbi:hypothetical protein BD770DRAFT_19424 [Pilaira anomala]|nr:hypothetical protein BD770DRAFT_19424 [Pilaira anomala]
MPALEEAIISETQLLLEHTSKINATLKELNDVQIIAMIEKLRQVEKKMSTVFTFFKASMYTNNYEEKEDTNRPII